MSKMLVQWYDRPNKSEKTASPENPLPTAQYVQENGVWRPLTPADLGGSASGTKDVNVKDAIFAGEDQLTAPSEGALIGGRFSDGTFRVISVDENGNLKVNVASNKQLRGGFGTNTNIVAANGGTVNILAAPQAGYITYLKNLLFRVPAPAGATTGFHQLDVYYHIPGATGTSTIITQTIFNFDKPAYINANTRIEPDASQIQIPTDDGAFVTQLNGVVFDSNIGFGVHYFNNTDADMTGTIEYQFALLDEQVRS